MKKLIIPMAGIALSAASANAALSITNSDFETGAGNNLPNVTGWFDGNTGNFFEDTWQTNNTGVSHDDSGIAVFSALDDTVGGDTNDGGYLYQSIGTADGATTLQLQFDWGGPQDAAAGRDLGLTIGVYAYDGIGAFTAGDDTDIRGAAGVTLLSSFSLQNLNSPANGPQILGQQVSLGLAGAGSQQLFLRFNNYDITEDESWVYLDNVTIIPEPSAALLGGIGLLGLLRRRRN